MGGQVIPTPLHVLGRISPVSPPCFPVFRAFSPSRRGGSNEPQAGTQGQETAGKTPPGTGEGVRGSQNQSKSPPLPGRCAFFGWSRKSHDQRMFLEEELSERWGVVPGKISTPPAFQLILC